jgi:hypothetical protein
METVAKMDDTSSVAPTADSDIEAQNGEGSTPPPYAASEMTSGNGTPKVTPDGDDMVINFPGWRVVIKKS